MNALITCGELLLPEDLATLGKLVELKTGGCALSEEELIENIRDIQFYILGGEEKFTLQAAQNADNLKAVIFVGKNFETFVTEDARAYLAKKNIPIYATGGGEASVARTTVEEISTFWLIQGKISRQLRWNPKNAANLLAEQEIMVIGAGGIGLTVIEELHGRAKTLYHAGGRGAKDDLVAKGVNYEPDLAKAFAAGDIVTLHMAFVPGKTEGIIRYEHLMNMRKNSLFLNNARAELVDAKDLLQFLTLRPDVLCVWDVFYAEGPAFGLAMESVHQNIAAAPNFYFTQHTAAFRFPELTKPEYGRGLLRIIREKILEPYHAV